MSSVNLSFARRTRNDKISSSDLKIYYSKFLTRFIFLTGVHHRVSLQALAWYALLSLWPRVSQVVFFIDPLHFHSSDSSLLVQVWLIGCCITTSARQMKIEYEVEHIRIGALVVSSLFRTQK